MAEIAPASQPDALYWLTQKILDHARHVPPQATALAFRVFCISALALLAAGVVHYSRHNRNVLLHRVWAVIGGLTGLLIHLKIDFTNRSRNLPLLLIALIGLLVIPRYLGAMLENDDTKQKPYIHFVFFVELILLALGGIVSWLR